MVRYHIHRPELGLNVGETGETLPANVLPCLANSCLHAKGNSPARGIDSDRFFSNISACCPNDRLACFGIIGLRDGLRAGGVIYTISKGDSLAAAAASPALLDFLLLEDLLFIEAAAAADKPSPFIEY